MALIDDIRAFVPGCPQEEADRLLMLERLEADPLAFDRTSPLHFTASAWTVDPKGEQTLLVYHNIFDSWSWVGGHADGEQDLAAVAKRELAEETGVTAAWLVNLGMNKIFSLEAVPVAGHMRHDQWVSSHAHLNVTYLFIANPDVPVFVQPEENSAVRWAPLDEVIPLSTEPWICEHCYAKLIERTREVLYKDPAERCGNAR